MSFDPFTAAFDMGKLALEKLFPDANKRAEEMRLLEELRQNGNLAELNAHVQLMLAQVNVNLEQAKSKSLFVAGSRPFIIWVCGLGLAFQYLLHPLFIWIWAFASMEGVPPEPLDMSVMMPLLLGLLGLGSMRSFDKKNGVQTDKIDK
jgi:hypothetical protein